MQLSSKSGFVWSVSLLCLFLSVPGSAISDDSRWDDLKKAYFGDRTIIEGDDVLALDAPGRAHDAATVPITIHAVDRDKEIKQVHLFADKNPLPMAGKFIFSEEAAGWHSFETRIRINEYTNIRAVAELSDGSLHMTTRFVKAAGGCSAPAMADLDAAMARAGKMKLLLDEISSGTEKTAEATIKVSHPNNSGMQFDQISRNYIPAFFITTIGAEMNGKELLKVETNFSLSENPMIRLNFSPEVDHTDMQVYALDSKGNRFEGGVSIGVN